MGFPCVPAVRSGKSDGAPGSPKVRRQVRWWDLTVKGSHPNAEDALTVARGGVLFWGGVEGTDKNTPFCDLVIHQNGRFGVIFRYLKKKKSFGFFF